MSDASAAAALASLAADRAALRHIDAADLDRRVPGCPDWDLATLIGHLGWVHRFATLCLAAPVDADVPIPDIHTPTDATVIAWLDEGLAALLAELDPPDLDRRCPTFLGPGTRAWWLRRQAFETAVHRWDVESTIGAPRPIPNAIDGIDEWLDLQPLRGWVPPPDLVGTLHLHSTDEVDDGGDGGGGSAPLGEWFIELDGSMHWEHSHRKADVAVRGTASDLYLMLWGRVPAEHLDIIGNSDVLERFLGVS